MKKLLFFMCVFSVLFCKAQSLQTLGSGISNNVQSLAVYNGNLYAGGHFSYAGGNLANNIAVWNGSNWLALGSGISGNNVYSIAVYNGEICAGGYIDSAIVTWNGTSWASLGGGLNGIVWAMTVYNGNLYVAGNFSASGNNSLSTSIAEWNGTSWSSIGTGISGSVYALAFYNGNLYVGGLFSTAGGILPIISRSGMEHNGLH